MSKAANRALKITGSFRGITGHDRLVRAFVRELHSRGLSIELRDLPQWSPAKLPENARDQWYEALQKPVAADLHLFFCMPHQVPADVSDRSINYTMFEADRIPQTWVEAAKRQSRIVVPVRSCRDAWISSGVPAEKVQVCSMGVDNDSFRPDVPQMKIATRDGCNAKDFSVRFLTVCDAIPRKNLKGLLRAWLTSTNKTDDAALILKPGFFAKAAHQRLMSEIYDLERTIGKKLSDAAQVFWVTGAMADDAIPSLFTAATHYLSASFGEGFDMPMVEAGASGLQLIAPKHSAYLDYLNDDLAYLVPAKPAAASVPDDPAMQRLFEGAQWWQPDESELCATIDGIIKKRLPPKEGAREALEHLTWKRAAEKLERLLFEEELDR